MYDIAASSSLTVFTSLPFIVYEFTFHSALSVHNWINQYQRGSGKNSQLISSQSGDGILKSNLISHFSINFLMDSVSLISISFLLDMHINFRSVIFHSSTNFSSLVFPSSHLFRATL
jgi:hypothetical protein